MKNIFKDKEQIKPILKEIIELSDDRKIILFEYFATKKQLTEETFNELMIELKGDEMPSVARIWMERGKEEGREEGKKEGKLEIAKNLLDVLDNKTIAIKTGLTEKEIEELRK